MESYKKSQHEVFLECNEKFTLLYQGATELAGATGNSDISIIYKTKR